VKDLRQQLIEAGLVSKEDARKASHDKRVRQKKQPPPAKRDKQAQAAAPRPALTPEQEAQRERDRALEAQRQQERTEKESRASTKQKRKAALAKALEDGVLAQWEGRRAYHFQVGASARIDTLQVTEEAARRLEAGQAAIMAGGPGAPPYTVITAGAAARVAEVAADAIVCWHRAS
jgi:hypothetical protein